MNRLPSCKVSGAVLLAVIAFIAAMVFLTPDRSDAAVYPMEGPDRPVTQLRVAYVEKVVMDDLLYVEFNDGSVAAFTPCRFEGSGERNCYWLGRQRGNGVGRSYVVLHRQVHYIRHHLLVEAGLS